MIRSCLPGCKSLASRSGYHVAFIFVDLLRLMVKSVMATMP